MGFPYGNVEKKKKMSGYLNGLKENKYMNFLIKAD